eukprot:TRINITY_DN49875_c0_g1_i1.p1 TRINITY_DN49875_c0_g1~~TRINITY_DN49875_c0_g1_i1.p1  ORF type:complete len:523 (+),score=170.63 TRINITY_DN49875_c0_g1_i1:86-1654(+)
MPGFEPKPGARICTNSAAGVQKGTVEEAFGKRKGDDDKSLKGWWWVKLDNGKIALLSPAQLQPEDAAPPEAAPQAAAAAMLAARPSAKAPTAGTDSFAPVKDASGNMLRPGIRIRVKDSGCGQVDAAYGAKPGDEDSTLRELGMWWVQMDNGSFGLKAAGDMTAISDVHISGACKAGNLPRGECPCGERLRPRVNEGYRVQCSGCNRKELEDSQHGYWYCPQKTCDYSACTHCCKGPQQKQAQKRAAGGALILSKRGKTQEEQLREKEAAELRGSGWVEYFCGKTMRKYYHNGQTEETTWVPPAIPNIACGHGDPDQPPPPDSPPPEHALVVPGAQKPDLQRADVPREVEAREAWIRSALADLQLIPGLATDKNTVQKALNAVGGLPALCVHQGLAPEGMQWDMPGRIPELLHGLCKSTLGAFATLPVMFVCRKDSDQRYVKMDGGYARGPGSHFCVLFAAGRPIAEDSGERPNGQPLPAGRECPCNRVLGNAAAVLDLHWQGAKRRRRMEEEAQRAAEEGQ